MQLKINASTPYMVTITSGMQAFSSCVQPLAGSRVAVITDENVAALYPHYLDSYFEGKRVFTYVVEAGEESKSGESYLRLLNDLAQDGFDRDDTIVTFGGGVVGDLGAFVASTYLRGIRLIAVPTTLLADVDSSVGGKTAINLQAGKNLCGTFYQPSAVYINVDFLNTLPPRERACGKGEIAKYVFLSQEKQIFPTEYQPLIAKCLDIKRTVVEKDEKEGGLRKLLNLGHTFGHAVEKLENYCLSHGECVGIGLRYTVELSHRLGYMSVDAKQKAQAVLDAYGCKTNTKYDLSALLEVMKHDKKNHADGVDFVLLDENLNAFIQRVTLQTVKAVMA